MKIMQPIWLSFEAEKNNKASINNKNKQKKYNFAFSKLPIMLLSCYIVMWISQIQLQSWHVKLTFMNLQRSFYSLKSICKQIEKKMEI